MISFEPLKKALASLEDAIEPPPRNDRERDGAIQRFEYTFELFWKVGKKVLGEHGIISMSPKSVMRDLAQQGWIDDADIWIMYLKARNYTSQTYNEKTAEWVYSQTSLFTADCRKALTKLSSL